MQFAEIWIRIVNLLFRPVSAWKKMKSEKAYALETIILLFSACLLLGFTSLLRKDHGWVPEALIPFISCLVFSVVIRTQSVKMRKVNWEGSLNLIVYSALPCLLAYSLCFIIGYRLYILLPAFIYSLIQFGLGLYNLLSLKLGETLGFTLLSLLLFLFVVYFAQLIFSV